ncbi:MAG TPA: TFIIB-type zinc finger domain-containing protein, partial [Terriglobales bacterium]|nr:TFIIB-type zinc finger domain-containing protein [Terriglobales bacterium]
MFCDQCGVQLDAGQRYCNRCGKEVKGPVSFAAPRPGRVEAHVRFLGILWLALSAFDVVGGAAALVVANVVFRHVDAPIFVGHLVRLVGLFSIAKAAAGFLTGWGLLNRQPWARSLAIVVGIISLFFHI